MKSLRSYALSAFFAAVAAAGATTAWAHAILESATPAKDAVVTAPREVSLRFNEKLEAAFSSAQVLDSRGKPVTAGKAAVDAANPAVMRVPVQNLAPGKYTVQFGVVGHDGHRRKGEYSFTVK
jgi:methionine-rich copper-binding protein CopC